jgi:aminoglycoside/choline kinase family phosphotransferase
MTRPQPAGGLPVPERIGEFLRVSRLADTDARIVPLTGDASDRRYFRIVPSSGESIILALHADAIDFGSLPFAHVARLLAAMPLPVPAIVGHSDALGIVALQDLGDITLQAYLGAATHAEQMARYREAVGLIDHLQRRGAELAPEGGAPYALAFDVEKLIWELRFFVQHFLEGCRGATVPVSERTALDEEWLALAAELSAEPRVLCHRDYHSRNLMLHDGRLHAIDFQDARMGPDTYDLASLLRDSYVDIATADLDALIAHFMGLKGLTDEALFRSRFDLMALQRNLKALGTFGNQATVRGNPAYLQYVPRTLNYVRLNLDTHPRFGRLRGLLARHVQELR